MRTPGSSCVLHTATSDPQVFYSGEKQGEKGETSPIIGSSPIHLQNMWLGQATSRSLERGTQPGFLVSVAGTQPPAPLLSAFLGMLQQKAEIGSCFGA